MDEEDASGTDAKGLTRNSLSETIYARLRVALMTGVYKSAPSSISAGLRRNIKFHQLRFVRRSCS